MPASIASPPGGHPSRTAAWLGLALAACLLAASPWAEGAPPKGAPAKVAPVETALAADDAAQVEGLPVVWQSALDAGLDQFVFTDPEAWKLGQGEQADGEVGPFLSLIKASQYEPPHRSPFNIARVDGLQVGDFDLTVDVKSTVADYDHRDLVLVFGYQDPSHFYYVHIGKRSDDHAHQIFIVNDAPRIKISTGTTAGMDWTDGWHALRLTRRLDTGRIELWIDGADGPTMTAEDRTFGAGGLGVGSFDDTGDFDNLVVRGVKAEAG